MPSKEIKSLRQAGKLEEAYQMAKSELDADPENIWSKRNISWVLYDYLKQNNSSQQFKTFLKYLREIAELKLLAEEKMLFDNVGWQVGKEIFSLIKGQPVNINYVIQLLQIIKGFSFSKPSEGYSFLFKAFHKALKDTNQYIEMADWWGFDNFRPEDYKKEKLPNGKEIMALAEQGYIAYAKHLLPKGGVEFDKEAVKSFIDKLSILMEQYPEYQYPPYFKAKLLLAADNKADVISTILPFAKKKRNDFWVWELLGQAFSDDEEKMFACFCKALSCKSPQEMLVGVRQELTGLLIKKKLYAEAKKEIELILHAREEKGWKIPNVINLWIEQDWYKNIQTNKSNNEFYKRYNEQAEDLLFYDVPEESIIVDFVNTNKKILNFIASEKKFGFFKYDRFLKKVNTGQTLCVRFSHGTVGGSYQVFTVSKCDNEGFKNKFLKAVEGKVRIQEGKSFGFLNDIFIPPPIVAKEKLSDGAHIKRSAIKSYDSKKKQWSWRII